MVAKEAWRLTKAFFKSLVDSWFVIVFILGVFTYLALKSPHVEIKFEEELLSVCKAIIFSSIFASMTRWLSVHGIVKSTLKEILEGKEHLDKSENFEKVWGNLVDVSISKHNPALAGHLNKSSLRRYLPTEGELFYSGYNSHIKIKSHDRKNNTITLIETLRLTVDVKDKSLHRLPFTFHASMPTGKGLEYEITTLKIGTECHLDKVIIDDIETNDLDNTDNIKIHYELPLEDKTQYQVHRVMVRQIALDFEPYLIAVSGKHTLKPEISYSANNTDIIATFNSTGTLEAFDTIEGRNHSQDFTERHPNLMLKGQGYVIYFAQ